MVVDVRSDEVSCLVCSSRETAAVLTLEDVPVLINQPAKDHASALSVPRANMQLQYCEACGHLFNSVFDATQIDYDAGYENALDHSPRFREYATDLVTDLTTRCELGKGHVVELACGQGGFLKALCAAGNCSGTGFDPSYRGPKQIGSVRFLADHFDAANRVQQLDLLCCRHALEHIEQPLAFLREVREFVGPDCPAVFFEVPNSRYTLDQLGIWDLIYEHVSYFSERSLKRVFESADFDVLEVTSAFGGQFLNVHARPAKPRNTRVPVSAEHDELQHSVREFRSRFVEKVEEWRQRLDSCAMSGREAVLWGGGSKGNTFLNVLQASEVVSRVVDINPAKQGCFVPGTGQIFVAPDDLQRQPPELVIVMNPIYEAEISAELRRMGLDAEVLVA